VGEVRLSPPLTILAIVAAAFGAMAIARPSDECAFTPDGQPRSRSLGTILSDRLVSPGFCDPWQDIEPRKPIETIELSKETDGGAHIVARIAPDGSGFVAVLPPFPIDKNPVLQSENPPEGLFRSIGKVFKFGPDKNLIYTEVLGLIGPMRDFQGGWLLELADPKNRFSTGFGDPLTRKIICKAPVQIFPAKHGPVITFRFAGRDQPAYVGTGVNCIDAAQSSAERRVAQAIAVMVTATGRTEEIGKLGEQEYPACRVFDSKGPCVQVRE